MRGVIHFYGSALAITLVASMSATSCQDKPKAGTTPAGSASGAAKRGTPESPWVLGMSQCNLGEPWRVQM